MGKKYEFDIDEEARVTSFLSIAVGGLSRAAADILVKNGEVKVNGKRIRSNVTLGPGDTVSVFVPESIAPAPIDVRRVYEDDNVVVFDKPKRLAYNALPDIFGAPLIAVHRLDTNTSGLIIFAKNETVGDELSAAFRERRVHKQYEAVVYPAPQSDGGVLTAYTKMLHSQNLALVSDEQKQGYKTMITEYRVVRRVGGGAVLRITLHTGRTHQIRAHMRHIGCPIVGEHKYGGREHIEGAPDTQMLAAVRLEFEGLKGRAAYLNGMVFEVESGFDISFLCE